MDIVITYVNGLDPLWQQDYAAAVGGTALTKRFRDWGTLKYLLRGIEKNMPFVENVFLLVSRESQVPGWVDRKALHVVLHEDIIPEKYLPTFNSTTIEMFLHRIQGLAEEYIYFNDDIFPVREVRPDEFFRDGKVCVFHRTHRFGSGLYRCQVRNSDALARKAAGLPASVKYIRPQHTCSAMLKSECEELWSSVPGEIEASLSPTRTERNLNQYLFSDWFLYRGRTVREKISNVHFSLAFAGARRIAAFIASPTSTMMGVNDVKLSDTRYRKCREALLNAFEKAFPQKSRFEL